MKSTPAFASTSASRSASRGYRSKPSPGPNWIGFTKMLTTTRSFSRHDRSTRLRCPAWSAPIVGTRPIAWPSRRQRRDTPSIFPGSSITAALLSGAVLDLVFFAGRLRRSAVGRVGVFRSGEFAAGNFPGELLGGVPNVLGEIGVSLDELRRLTRGQAERVMEDKNLSVGSGAGADADGRDAKRLRDAAPKLARNSFQDQAERPGLLELLGVGQDPGGLGLRLALDLEAAHLVDELGCEAEVTHHGNSELRQATRDLDDPAPALELHGMHAALLQETPGAGDRLLD